MNQQVEGVVAILGHCSFEWVEERSGGYRIAYVEAGHCPRCVTEVRKLGFSLRYVHNEAGDQKSA